MIWKTLAAVAAAIVLVIAINFIGNAVFEASTPAEQSVARPTAGDQLKETPTVSKADVGQGEQTAAQTTTDPAPEAASTPQTQPVPTEGAAQVQEQAQEQAKDGEQAPPEPAATAPAQDGQEPQQQAAATPATPAAAGGAAGDAEAGKAAARVCAACHSFDQGGPNKVGPNLFGVVGGDIAAKDGFKYSDALQKEEGAWTAEKLDAYLANPKEAIPGNKMAYAGLKDEAKRKDLIAYLASLK
ncbi:c-type cytochrome [Novispirillum sp. DQ9]|uniref:c-type cytochrome n=1 Tax=Novispirillum sp. DQ9 TaxID=3398612 RepID=UPI003C7BF0CE